MPSMCDPREVPVSQFAHVKDQSGKFHSVCRVCLHSIAEELRESHLFETEEQHKCDGPPSTVYSRDLPPSPTG